MRSVLVLAVVMAAAAAQIQDPGTLALVLNEEEFEDRLDAYLEQEESRPSSAQRRPRSIDCTFKINGDLGQPQPVYLVNNPLRGLKYMAADGNSGEIHLNNGDEVVVACVGSGQSIQHPSIAARRAVATATCVNDNLVSGAGWLNGNGNFGQLTCSKRSSSAIQEPNLKCWNNNIVIFVGFYVNNVFYRLYGCCFDPKLKQVLYVWYDQTPANAVHQNTVQRPNTWKTGRFYPEINFNSIYNPEQQKNTIAQIVGHTRVNDYINKNKRLLFSRGHLAAKSDFVFATGQLATFYYINTAPQWQTINAGNWNKLEQDLRARIGAAGYHTVIYTGTYGVMKLPVGTDKYVDIYLSRGQIPVPLYFYKVVYEKSSDKGTAFITINNPHYTLAEAKERADEICADRCRNNDAFNWLTWDPDHVLDGYSFCCTVDDFRSTIPHLPHFVTTNGLLA